MISPYKDTHTQRKPGDGYSRRMIPTLQNWAGGGGGKRPSASLCMSLQNTTLRDRDCKIKKGCVRGKENEGFLLRLGPKKYLQWKRKPWSRSHPDKLPCKCRDKPSCSSGWRPEKRFLFLQLRCWPRLLPGFRAPDDKEPLEPLLHLPAHSTKPSALQGWAYPVNSAFIQNID